MFKVRTDGSARSMLLTSSNDGYYSTFPAQVFKTDSRQQFILSKIMSQATSIEQKLGTLKILRSANRNGNAGRDPIRLAPLSFCAASRLAPIQSRKLSVTKVSAKKAGMTFLPLLCHFGSLVPFRAMAIECQSAMLVHNSISETPALNDSHHVINEAQEATIKLL